MPRVLRVSEDIVPVSELKAHAAEWMRKAAETGAPVVVTQNGRPAAVLLSPQAYDELTARARFLGAVEEGLADADAGRVTSHAALKREMKERFGKKTRRRARGGSPSAGPSARAWT